MAHQELKRTATLVVDQAREAAVDKATCLCFLLHGFAKGHGANHKTFT